MLRLLAHNAEHRLSGQLDVYLLEQVENPDDDGEIITGGSGWHHHLDTCRHHRRLAAPRIASRSPQALALLIAQMTQDPPAMPGDHRPITYQITANQSV